MTVPPTSTWSKISFACPVCSFAFAFAAGRGIANDELSLRIIGIASLGFLFLALIALICAFRRKERLRWLTIPSLVLILTMLVTGISS